MKVDLSSYAQQVLRQSERSTIEATAKGHPPPPAECHETCARDCLAPSTVNAMITRRPTFEEHPGRLTEAATAVAKWLTNDTAHVGER
uniref:Uncharacterized protein n=1 Tax=Plectus sambesii TaxID=2011161 RepID=A0A914X1T4_9BILA